MADQRHHPRRDPLDGSAIEDIEEALVELRLTTKGYELAKKNNPNTFPQTHQGRCEAALRRAIARFD